MLRTLIIVRDMIFMDICHDWLLVGRISEASPVRISETDGVSGLADERRQGPLAHQDGKSTNYIYHMHIHGI